MTWPFPDIITPGMGIRFQKQKRKAIGAALLVTSRSKYGARTLRSSIRKNLPLPTYLKGTHLRKPFSRATFWTFHGLLTPSGKGFPPEGRWNAFLSQWIWLLSFPRTLSRDPQRPLFTKSAHIREIVHAISLYPKLSHNPLFHFKKKVWSYLRSISSSSIV
jgi:hypothetical protein